MGVVCSSPGCIRECFHKVPDECSWGCAVVADRLPACLRLHLAGDMTDDERRRVEADWFFGGESFALRRHQERSRSEAPALDDRSAP